MRKTMNISMSEEMHDFIVKRMGSTYYSSTSEYIRSLIRRDQLECEKPKKKMPPLRRANDVIESYLAEKASLADQNLNGN